MSVVKALANVGVQAARKAAHDGRSASSVQSGPDLLVPVGVVDPGHGEVFADGEVIAKKVLEEHADTRSQLALVSLTKVDTTKKDAACRRVVEPQEKLEDSGL